MIELNDTEISLSFPHAGDKAVLRVQFCGVDSPEEKLRIRGAADSLQLMAQSRFVVRLRPHSEFYPFAVLVSVDGKNAITGDDSTTLVRSPQNYFASPPQGGIDGYFVDERVLPFRAGGDSPAHRSYLAIKVFPIKKETIENWIQRRRMCGAPHHAISGVTLRHGGARQCEPIYEDLCSIGDWDTSHAEEVVLWLTGP
jgi:hypothetical protein